MLGLDPCGNIQLHGNKSIFPLSHLQAIFQSGKNVSPPSSTSFRYMIQANSLDIVPPSA